MRNALMLILLLQLAGCSSKFSPDEMTGSEGWPCRPDKTCNAGLVCLPPNFCVRPRDLDIDMRQVEFRFLPLDRSVEGTEHDGVTPDGTQPSDGPKIDGPKSDGSTSDGPKIDGPKSDGSKSDGPRPDAAPGSAG